MSFQHIITAMLSYIYPQSRRLSFPLFMLLFALLLSASAQIADSAPNAPYSTFYTESNDPEYLAILGYKSRGKVLLNEGFEQFRLLSDSKGNALVEYALSGRFGYLHIRAEENTSRKKLERAISKAFEVFKDVDGVILDLRFNRLEEASQHSWLQYILEKEFSGPGVLISSYPISLPQNWHFLYTSNDKIIQAALRKLRVPQAEKDFDLIWGK